MRALLLNAPRQRAALIGRRSNSREKPSIMTCEKRAPPRKCFEMALLGNAEPARAAISAVAAVSKREIISRWRPKHVVNGHYIVPAFSCMALLLLCSVGVIFWRRRSRSTGERGDSTSNGERRELCPSCRYRPAARGRCAPGTLVGARREAAVVGEIMKARLAWGGGGAGMKAMLVM